MIFCEILVPTQPIFECTVLRQNIHIQIKKKTFSIADSFFSYVYIRDGHVTQSGFVSFWCTFRRRFWVDLCSNRSYGTVSQRLPDADDSLATDANFLPELYHMLWLGRYLRATSLQLSNTGRYTLAESCLVATSSLGSLFNGYVCAQQIVPGGRGSGTFNRRRTTSDKTWSHDDELIHPTKQTMIIGTNQSPHVSFRHTKRCCSVSFCQCQSWNLMPS